MTLTSATRRRRRRRTAGESRWIITFPVGVLLVVGLFPGLALVKPIGAIVLLGLVIYVSKRPGPALVALISFVLLQPVVFPFLYKLGLRAEILRALAGTKEALIASLVVSAIITIRAEERKLDRLDRFVLAFLGGVTLYTALPFLAGPDAPTDLSVRLLGFRTNALFLILFLGVRHAAIDATWRRRAMNAAIALISVTALVGLYQYFFAARFSDFVLDDIAQLAYKADVNEISRYNLYWDYQWLFTDPIRVGAWLVSPFDFSDLMLIGAGVAMAYVVQTRARSWQLGFLALCGAGILASHTRAAVLGLIVGGLVALRPAPGRSTFGRVRFLLVGVGVAALVAPNLIGTRFTGSDGADKSSTEHVSELTTGLQRVIEHPLGAGLGTAPDVGARNAGAVDPNDVFISDNSVLQVGQELGIVMMLLFVAVLIALFSALAHAPPRSDHLAPAARVMMACLLAAGMLHHVFLAIPTTWTAWSIAGLGAAVASTRDRAPAAVEATDG